MQNDVIEFNAKIRKGIRRAFGKIFSRLEAMSFEYKTEQRQQALAKFARIDPTATIGDTASLVNKMENPDDIVIGENSAVLGELVVFPHGGKIAIGEKCFIGAGTRIWSSAQISIGNYVIIAHNVNIHDNNSHSISWEERRKEIDVVLPNMAGDRPKQDLKARPITIEDDVWIGFNSVVLEGVRIGRGAIIGAASVVTNDIPAFSLVVGNPMKIIPRTL